MVAAMARLEGWSGTLRSRCRVARVANPDDCRRALRYAADHELTVCPRGAGLSWADSALNTGELVMDTSAMRRILRFDARRGSIVVEPGATLAEVLAVAWPHGWTLHALPGSLEVTVAGAVGANVHGKDGHRHGCFADQVRSVDLIDARGEVRRIDDRDGRDRLDAIRAGLGLIAVLVAIELRLARRSGDSLLVSTVATRSLDETVDELLDDTDRHHALGWIDCFGGKGRQRAGFVRHAREGAGTSPRGARSAASRLRTIPGHGRLLGRAFRLAGPGVRPGAVRVFNLVAAAHARREQRRGPREMSLLDSLLPHRRVPAINRLFSPRGFIEVQVLLPLGSVRESLPELLDVAARVHMRSIVCALKRHRPARGHLSFAGDGISASIVVPCAWLSPRALARGAGEIHAFVTERGGRIYLGKDQFAGPRAVARMYPGLERFLDIKRELDPCGRFMSDLGRRILPAAASA